MHIAMKNMGTNTKNSKTQSRLSRKDLKNFQIKGNWEIIPSINVYIIYIYILEQTKKSQSLLLDKPIPASDQNIINPIGIQSPISFKEFMEINISQSTPRSNSQISTKYPNTLTKNYKYHPQIHPFTNMTTPKVQRKYPKNSEIKKGASKPQVMESSLSLWSLSRN